MINKKYISVCKHIMFTIIKFLNKEVLKFGCLELECFRDSGNEFCNWGAVKEKEH